MTYVVCGNTEHAARYATIGGPLSRNKNWLSVLFVQFGICHLPCIILQPRLVLLMATNPSTSTSAVIRKKRYWLHG